MTVEFTEYHTRLAAYALIVDDQDRALLAWWNGEGHSAPAWSLPGGGIEFEESIRDGLVREVYEETGYHVAPGPLLVDDFFTARGRSFDGWLRSQRFVGLDQRRRRGALERAMQLDQRLRRLAPALRAESDPHVHLVQQRERQSAVFQLRGEIERALGAR